jgi:hypothetical protein
VLKQKTKTLLTATERNGVHFINCIFAIIIKSVCRYE